MFGPHELALLLGGREEIDVAAVLGDLRRRAFAAANPRLHGLSAHVAIAAAGSLLCVLALPLDVPVASIPVSGLLLSLLIALCCLHRPAWRG
jgi:hypothetical protein